MTYRSLETKSRANMAAMAKICNPVSRERIHFFKWKLEWYFAISYAIQNTFLAILKKNYIAELWDRMSFSDFRSAVRSFIVLRHFFTEFDRFLLVLSKQLCLVVKTTVLCCFPGCGGSPLTSITTAYYAVMRAWRNLLLVAVLRSNWSNVLLIYCQLHHTTPKITRNIQGNPNLRLG